MSAATKLLSPAELLQLLKGSRKRNEALGITGILLYKDGNFMHVIEGEQAAVEALSAKIATDPRHHTIISLLRGPVQERQFPDYSMAFHNLSAAEVGNFEGYSEFLNTPLTGKEFVGKPTRVQKLLLLFKRNMR